MVLVKHELMGRHRPGYVVGNYLRPYPPFCLWPYFNRAWRFWASDGLRCSKI